MKLKAIDEASPDHIQEVEFPGCTDTIDYLDKETINEIISDMPAADVEPVRKWIPVKESMPPEKTQYISEKSVLTGAITKREYIGSDLVIVAVENNLGELFVSEDNTADGEWCCYGNMDIIAWMPLPEPPKMDGGSEE